MTTSTLPEWAAHLVGDGAEVVEVFSGGTSRATVLVEVPPDRHRLVLRHDGGAGPFSGSGFTLRREAAATAFAHSAGVPVAEVIAVSDDGASVAVSELPGVPAGPGDAVDEYLAILGRLHATALDDAPSGFRGFDRDGREDLAMWRDLADGLPDAVPVLDAAFDLLDRHGWSTPSDVAFCHGDAGSGNYLCDDGRVTGLIDWEMAHTADPHDDLASVAVRAVLAGADVERFVERVAASWTPASGRRFDRDRFRVAVVAVLARMVVSCHAALAHPEATHDRTVQLMGLPLMEVHLVRTAALVEGVALDEDVDVAADPTYLARMADLVAEHVRDGDAVDRRRARRVRYIADQLTTALRSSTGPVPVTDDLAGLWRGAQSRLAAVPASRALAERPIPGVH